MPEQLVPHTHGLCAQKCPEASKATASLLQQSRCTVHLCELRNSNCSSQLPFHNVIPILGSKRPQVLRKSQVQSAAGKSGWCTVSHHQSVAGKESSNACGRNGRWRGQEEEEQGRRPCWEGCGGRVCIRPSPRAALHTENCCGWRKGLPGEHSAWLCRVRAPHSFILAVGAAAMLCGEPLGGWRGWRSTRMTLFWKYVPVEHSVSLGSPSPEPVEPLGPAPLTIVLSPSLMALLGKELARKRAKPARARAPFGTLEPKAGSFLPFFSLSLVLSFFP